MRKQILTLAVLALAGVVTLTGCKKKLAETTMPVMTFSATTDSGDDGSKTSLVPGNGAVLWTAGDQINVNGTTMPLSTGAGTINGTFTGSPSGSYYVAGYPSNATVDAGNLKVTFTLPPTQTLTENGFGNGANPMVAKSNSTALQFKNVCGGLAIRLWSESGAVDYIKVTSKDGKCLNGSYVVDYSGDTPSMTAPTTGSDNIVLSGTPVTLSTEAGNPTVFYVMLPVNSYPGGFNVVAKSGGSGGTEVLNQDFAAVTSIERNRLYLLASTKTANDLPEGALSGVFSVSPTKQVYFSKGNLKYNGSTSTWSFEENQWDCVTTHGTTWGHFGWSTLVSNYGMKTSEDDKDYSGDFVDWGSNSISNGGTGWRTLIGGDSGEWRYLFCERTDASLKYGKATVNDVHGVVILPDTWTNPSGVPEFKNDGWDPVMTGWDLNTYDMAQWVSMEANGAVFLPAAGGRQGEVVEGVGDYGLYWSFSACGEGSAYYLSFDNEYRFYPDNYGNRYCGLSVRLVRDVK